MSTVRLSLLGDCVIHVGGTAVDPSSTHLFALLLVLGLESDRRVHRSELHRLLFAQDLSGGQASHNLRQLLYRLRRLGVTLDETVLGVRFPSASVLSFGDQLGLLTSSDCKDVAAVNVVFLPSYAPKLPQPYLDWLDRQRDIADDKIRSALSAAAARLRNSHDWHAAYRVSKTLASLDPYSEEVLALTAESLTMMGRRNEALLLLNSFDGASTRPTASVDSLRPLRARIARLEDPRHEGTLRGRNECLASLEAEWDRIGREGARRAVLIGHAGIGKTRVADAFAARVKLLGAHVTRYTCDAASAEQPLGLFSDILPQLRNMRGSIGASPDLASALDRLRPAIAPSGALAQSDMSVEAVRSEVQRALIDLLEAVSEDRPLMLLIDDAHYLDPVSANLIRSLCAKDNAARLFVLLCVRTSHATAPLFEPARRSLSYVLEPLSEVVSRQVVMDVAGPDIDEPHVDWCLAQSAGNPFYLHTLASQRFVDTRLVPFDISSLAANAYSFLVVSTRAVLETCLLLGRLATLGRVESISGVTGAELLAALRELETLDLLQFSDGALIGPHALLHDALLRLIPSSVAALLHSRIAAALEAECEAEQYVFPIAWAAAQSWMAAGDAHAAAALMRRCAHHAAFIGEIKVATELLSEITDAALPAAVHAELLDELTIYAEASASPATLALACRKRLKLSTALGDSADRVREFQRRIIDADLMAGGQSTWAIAPLMSFLSEETSSPITRAHAATRLMVIADQELDANLAQIVFAHLQKVPRDTDALQSVCVRAEVVYHTFCGDTTLARELSLNLLAQYATPSVTQESIKARFFAAFALQRLRDERASSVFRDMYSQMMSHGIQKQALYSASGVTAIALADGDFDTAREWIAMSKRILRGESAHEISPQSGHYCNDALLAMHEGRYDEAEPLIFAPAEDYSSLAGARQRATCLAIWIRLKQLRGDPLSYESALGHLEDLYVRGKSLGGQDVVMEALWSSRVLANHHVDASRMLSDYLRMRRENVAPEWSLSHTTAADDAWILT